MSKKSWKQEYYAVPARKVKECNALQHSLQKWIGLRAENLKKHGLLTSPIHVNSDTCALCYHYISLQCKDCPLAQSRESVRCDNSKPGEKASPYMMYKVSRNPEPMIAALQEAML